MVVGRATQLFELAALGRREEAEVLGLLTGLPIRGLAVLGAYGWMLMVERVGIALADLCETCPGRRGGCRGGGGFSSAVVLSAELE